MGNKICGDETGTPWVNFSINCVRVNNSENINIDRTDGVVEANSLDDSDSFLNSLGDLNGVEEPVRRCGCCSCLPWPRRNKKA